MTRLWSVMQADHALVWELLNQLTGGKGDPGGTPRERRRTAMRLVALESVHEVAEEVVVWPAVREHCRDGDQLVVEVLAQERRAKRAVNELAHLSPGTEEFMACVHTIAGLARAHLSYEENQVWPRLADAVRGADLDRMAEQWGIVRRAAPTRPHPHTPPDHRLLAAVGPLVGRVDRARDLLVGRQVPTP